MENITKLLRAGANPALRYQDSLSPAQALAQTIIRYFEDETDFQIHLPRLVSLITNHDYRLVAEYLFALKNHNEQLLSILDELAAAKSPNTINCLHYQLSYARFADTFNAVKKARISFTNQLEDVFLPQNQQLVIYLRDERHKAQLTALIDQVGTSIGKFIEQQYDMPGINAVVRQGGVRKWHLPDGTAVVSKRENPRKRDRFRTEQYNYDILLKKFGNQSWKLTNPANPEDNIGVQFAQPFAIVYDGDSGRRYSLSDYMEGISLEDMFFTERDTTIREHWLVHYRLLLDTMYESGILWSDMSPRNILTVSHQNLETTYILMDFEKTRILDGPISLAQRIEHCRGSICVEELGVLCPQEEVLTCFNGYFDPTKWDFESEAVLPFSPRPEIADVIQARGINDVRLGVFNQLDRDILRVRVPDEDPLTKMRRFPGHLGFKVEQYLSCAGNSAAGDYDRKTTEILIASKQQACFDRVVALLASVTCALEGALLDAEFISILEGGFSGNVLPPQPEIVILTEILDEFYQMRKTKSAYQKLVTKWQTYLKIGLT